MLGSAMYSPPSGVALGGERAGGPMTQITTATPSRAFPDGLGPVFVPVDPNRAPSSSLPKADVVVITWTVDELAGLAKVFCPGHSASKWARYTHRYPTFATQIRKGAPPRTRNGSRAS